MSEDFSSDSDSGASRDSGEDFGSEAGLSGLIKKVIVGGVSTMFVTQEKAREVLKELKLPKEILDSLLSNAGKTKSEFFHTLGKEFSRIAERIDFVEEGRRFLRDNNIRLKIEADVSFEPKEKSKAKKES